MDELIRAIQAMERGSIRLTIGGQAEPRTGASRFGGVPDVPADFVWPVFETATYDDDQVRPRPLTFLAQFDCEALAFCDKDHLLPRAGVLSFFYELGSQRWGFDPADAGCARVFWFPGRDALALAEARRRSVENWQLLFQLDTVADNGFELMFGDCGRVYFYIPKEDLTARRFDRVWLILQCG